MDHDEQRTFLNGNSEGTSTRATVLLLVETEGIQEAKAIRDAIELALAGSFTRTHVIDVRKVDL